MRRKFKDCEFIHGNHGLVVYVGDDMVVLKPEEAESLREFLIEADFEKDTLERAKRIQDMERVGVSG